MTEEISRNFIYVELSKTVNLNLQSDTVLLTTIAKKLAFSLKLRSD